MKAAAIQSVDDHARKATAWAGATLAAHSCVAHANADGSWDIETLSGWVVADDWRQLCVVARQVAADAAAK